MPCLAHKTAALNFHAYQWIISANIEPLRGSLSLPQAPWGRGDLRWLLQHNGFTYTRRFDWKCDRLSNINAGKVSHITLLDLVNISDFHKSVIFVCPGFGLFPFLFTLVSNETVLEFWAYWQFVTFISIQSETYNIQQMSLRST